jgi:hypothetical protein
MTKQDFVNSPGTPALRRKIQLAFHITITGISYDCKNKVLRGLFNHVNCFDMVCLGDHVDHVRFNQLSSVLRHHLEIAGKSVRIA